MKLKQIYAALDIGSYEVKLIVGEFHNTRFNVIRVEKVPCSGISEYTIVDREAVRQSILTALKNVNDMLQVQIERVLLAIPANHIQRFSHRIITPILQEDGLISAENIQEAIHKACSEKIPSYLEIVNAIPVKYYMDGMATRRTPIGEKCSRLEVTIDLLCVKKDMLYDYVRIVEQSGLEVLDICAQPYADAKEAAILEQSVENHIIYINLGYQTSTLSLFASGRLSECVTLPLGTKQLDDAIVSKFEISTETASRIKQYGTHLIKDRVTNTPVHIYGKDSNKRMITEMALYETVTPVLEQWMDTIKDVCGDLLSEKDIRVVFGGGGAEIFELDEYAQLALGVDTTCYVPETMGARNGALITTLGLFYAYKDALEYLQEDRISVDPAKYATIMLPSQISEEEGFTGRLKVFLFNEHKEKNKE
ncbi:MAG: pilus assembly protein PilM [Erysipelotrichales bacterium]|nr:pilus assembly protein PilM [Erysipelotrichales bacterium]